MFVRLMALAVLLVTLIGGPTPGLAQDATPIASNADPTEDEFTVLTAAAGPELPPDATFVALVRYTFAPGSASPIGPDPGPVLSYVEEGAIVATVDGPFEHRQADSPATPEAASGAGGEVVVEAGASLFVPGGVSTQYRNEGDEPATVLVVMVFPFDPFGALTDTGGLSVEVLVSRELATLPDGPTAIVLARQTIAPGGGFDPLDSPGPVLAYIESGRVTYTVAAGDSEVTRGGTEERRPEPVAEGEQVELEPGDSFAEEGGTTSGGRSAGEAPVDHLVVFIWPLEDWTPAPEASPVPAATPVS